MPQLVAAEPFSGPSVGVYRRNDEAHTSQFYEGFLRDSMRPTRQSTFLTSKSRFDEARWRLHRTLFLERDWDTYGAEPPSERARTSAGWVLQQLEYASLPPTRLMPLADGGIAMSFVEGENRAEIEVYNSGEVAAAVYSGEQEPVVWELANAGPTLRQAIDQIRVHLTK
jgi:hypothetical protein